MAKKAQATIDNTASSGLRSKFNIMRAAWFTPVSKGAWGLTLLMWGEPGVAKTDIIEGFASTLGLPCVTLSPGEMGEGAFGVIPVPDKSGVIKYPPPEWTAAVKDGGVVFIDEAVSCPPAIAPALQGLLLARRIGGHTLPGNVRRIAAANPPELATNGYDLSPPNANRVGHINWGAPTVEEHTAYMMSAVAATRGTVQQTVNVAAEEARVLAAWPEAWARAVGLETSFLAACPQHKNRCPKPGDPQASRAWPSDRAWESATRALASAQIQGLSEAETQEFVEAFIGGPVATEWAEFIEKQDLPDAAKLLDGSVTFEADRTRLDRTAAVLNACSTLVVPANAPNRVKRAEALWNLIKALMADKGSSDVLVPASQALVEAQLHTLPAAIPVLAKIQPLLKLAKSNH